MNKTKIQWAERTWNPIRGCIQISPGCRFCYAKTFAERFRGTPGHPYEFGFDLRLVPHKLGEPFKVRRPSVIFTNSMSDLFQEGVPDGYVHDVCNVMQAADWHIYQVLTKRAERMREFVSSQRLDLAAAEHVWLGTSVEDRRYGLPRIEHLRSTPAGVRFLSIEPLLEDLGPLDLTGIHWVIVGGESGPGARPMDMDWVRSIHSECQRQHVPFFFKQVGGVRKHKTGRLLDGRTYNETPVIVARTVPSKEDIETRMRALGIDPRKQAA